MRSGYHAKHILRLKPLKPLDQPMDAADYGSVVHEGLHLFLREHGPAWPANAAEPFTRLPRPRPDGTAAAFGRVAWWGPRIGRIAAWVAEIEAERRADAPPLRSSPR